MQSVSFELFKSFPSSYGKDPFQILLQYVGQCVNLSLAMQCSYCGASIHPYVKKLNINLCHCGDYSVVCPSCVSYHEQAEEITLVAA